MTDDDDDEVFYHLTAPVEDIEGYSVGGYHPVHLNDTLLDGRYLVIRKLGHGSYSTMWLVHDREASEFVAIKIKKAKDSTAREINIHNMVRDIEGNRMHIIQLINHFTIQGPNGSHSCLVFAAMGPRVIGLLHDPIPGDGPLHEKSPRLSLPVARQVLLQAVIGLDNLHYRGIIHGDVHAGNWLLELQDINKLTEKDLSQDPRNISAPVRRLKGEQNTGDPRHLTLNEPLYEWIATGENLRVRIADLGNAFLVDEPPDNPQTPIDIRSPELLLLKQISMSQDIWSFGCLVYRFLTDMPLFSLFNMGNPEALDDSHMLQFIEVLGPLPENLKPAWLNYYQYSDEHNVQTSFRNEWAPELDSVSSDTPSENGGDEGNENDYSVGDGSGYEHENSSIPTPDQSHILAHLVPSVVEMYHRTGIRDDDDDGNGDETDTYTPDLPLAGRFRRDKHPDMSQEETEAALDLLQQILKYDPAERPTTTDLLGHPWIEKFCKDKGDLVTATVTPPPETQHKRRRVM